MNNDEDSRQTVAGRWRSVRAELESAGVPDAGLESELLLRHALDLNAPEFFARLTDPFPEAGVEWLRSALERRRMREPLAYILGEREFYGRTFLVDQRVLIPRPETELLVDRALAFAAGQPGRAFSLADIGTGSGVLAITLALELPRARVYATDVCADALTVASGNARRLGVTERVQFLAGDLAEPLEGRFHIVVANLPYVCASVLERCQPEMRFEPHAALDGGPDGMRFVGSLVEQLPRIMAMERSVSLLEIDPPLVKPLERVVKRVLPYATMHVLDDLAGLARCAEIIVE